tara:strand:+ start:790 stop:1008 length:219 start_codon:yes stop_codon:yes gene_type:complete
MDAHGSARASVSIVFIRLGKRIESDAESESNRTESRARSVRTTTRTGGNAETRRVRRSHAVVERVVERVVVV